MSAAAELGNVAIVWRYRGGEFNWALEYKGGTLTPAHRDLVELTDLDLLTELLEEGQAAAYALNTDRKGLVERYRAAKRNGRHPDEERRP